MVIEADMTAQEKVDRAIVEITSESPFFSYLVLNAQFEPDPNFPALAGVGASGKGIYNPNMINPPEDSELETLSVEKVKGLIVHETLHLAFQHPWMDLPDHWDEEAKNIAQEMEINGTINLETDYELPENGYVPEDKDNFRIPMNEEETEFLMVEGATEKDLFTLYKEIVEQLEDQDEPEMPLSPTMGNEGEESQQGGSGGQGDTEENEDEMDDNTGEEGDSSDDKEDEQNGSGEDGLGDYDLDKQTGFDVHGQGDEEDADSKDTNKGSWDEALSKAVQHAVQAGSQPNGVEEKIEELMGHDFNWRDQLDQFIKEQIPQGFTYNRPSPTTRVINQQAGGSTYLPDVRYEETIDVIVSVDSSGSVSSELLGHFKSDMISIARSYEQVDMTVISHDTEVHDEWEMVNGQIEKLREWNPVGRGGTDLIAPVEYVKENHSPDILIMFTDGQGPRPDQVHFPIIWVLAGNHVDEGSIETGRTIVAKEGDR